jgi:hypothetical protein
MTNLTHNSFSVCLYQFSTCFEQTRAHHQENQLYKYNIWYVSPSSMQVGKELQFLPDLHTGRSRTQSDTYQMLYWYNWFSWWWARGCSKYVENWNKHIEKGIVCQVGHLQELYCKFAGHCSPVNSRNTASLVGDAGYILTKTVASKLIEVVGCTWFWNTSFWTLRCCMFSMFMCYRQESI